MIDWEEDYLFMFCLCSKYSYSVSGYGRLSSSSLWHRRPQKYPVKKPTKREKMEPAKTAITNVSTVYCALIISGEIWGPCFSKIFTFEFYHHNRHYHFVWFWLIVHVLYCEKIYIKINNMCSKKYCLINNRYI